MALAVETGPVGSTFVVIQGQKQDFLVEGQGAASHRRAS